MGTVRLVMETHPLAWTFFVPFMQSHGDVQRLEDDIRAMHEELRNLRRLLEDQRVSRCSSNVASDSTQGR